MARTSSVRRPASARSGPLGWLLQLTLHDRLVLVVALVALALRLWPLGGASTDYDEGVYWQSLRAMAAGHPLFGEVFSSQPPLFLLGLYPFYLMLGQSLIAARLAVVLYSLAGLAAMYFAGRAVAGRWAGLAACALLAVDPLYLRVSHTLQAEAPALAFQLACVALAAEAAKRPAGSDRRRRMLAAASGAALGLGIMVKLFDVVALLPALLYLATPLYAAFASHDGRIRRPERDALLARMRLILPDVGLLLAGTLATLLVVLLPFAGSWGALSDQVVRFHLAAASAASQGLGYNAALIGNSAFPAVFLVLIFVVPLLELAGPTAKILPPLTWLLASVVLLLRQQPLFDHHVALLIPPLALLAGIVAGDVLNAPDLRPHAWLRAMTPKDIRRFVFSTLCLVSLLLLIESASRDQSAARPISDDQRLISTALERLTVPGDVVVSDDQYVAGLADRDVVPQLVDTSEVRIATGELTTRQIEAIITQSDARVVLFASGRFDRLPGFRAWVRANFTEVGTFGEGRALYMKQPSAPVPV